MKPAWPDVEAFSNRKADIFMLQRTGHFHFALTDSIRSLDNFYDLMYKKN